MTVEELNVLINAWPNGTQGHDAERHVIAQMDALGAAIGYGALQQIATWLYDAQCLGDPTAAAALKRERFRAMGYPLPEDFETVATK